MAENQRATAVLDRTLDADLRSIRIARRLAREAAADAFVGDDERVAAVELATSEIVTNAVEHGSGENFTLHAESGSNWLSITVVSDGASSAADALVRQRSPERDVARRLPFEPGRSGRGLRIAATVADSMTVESRPPRVLVTCVFGTSTPATTHESTGTLVP